jgi:hypothetical protein
MDLVLEEGPSNGLDRKQVDEVIKYLDKAKPGPHTVARGTEKELKALKAMIREGGKFQGRKDITMSCYDASSEVFELRVVKSDDSNGTPAQSETDNAGQPF